MNQAETNDLYNPSSRPMNLCNPSPAEWSVDGS